MEPPTPAERHNRRLGVILFLAYLALYATFVGTIAYDYTLVAREAFAGLNVAVVSGFGLIFAAVVLAVVYAVLARDDEVVP